METGSGKEGCNKSKQRCAGSGIKGREKGEGIKSFTYMKY